jgi:hypothetical protein
MKKSSIRTPLLLSMFLGFSLPALADCGPEASKENKDAKVSQASAYVGTSKEAGNESAEAASDWNADPESKRLYTPYEDGGYNP